MPTVNIAVTTRRTVSKHTNTDAIKELDITLLINSDNMSDNDITFITGHNTN